MRKMYEVELKYVSYTTITVEARDEEEAEFIAWQELASDGSYRSDYGDWSLESIEPSKQQWATDKAAEYDKVKQLNDEE